MFSKIVFAVVFIHFISLGDCRCPRRNPCEPSPCDANATCNRMGKSFTCECNEGYSGDGYNCDAIIVDECDVAINDCGCHEICTVSPDGNTCDCEEGYSSDGTSPCQPTDPPLYHNLCDVGEVCYDNVTCCTGVPEPGNQCMSNDSCPDNTFCWKGRCRCDGVLGYHVDASGQCASSCGTYGTSFSYYPLTHPLFSSDDLLGTYANAETCLTECLNNAMCDKVLIINAHFVDPNQGFGTACIPLACYLVKFNDERAVLHEIAANYMYVRNCA